MKISLVLITVIVTFQALSVSAELPKIDRILTEQTLPEEIEKAFSESWHALKVSQVNRQLLCKPLAKTQLQESIPSALSSLKAEGTLTLYFNDARVLIDFQPTSVTIRASRPENENDRNGIVAPFFDDSRWGYLRSKSGFDMLVWLPNLSGCENQFIALCPRNLKPVNVFSDLEISDFSASADWRGFAEAVLISSTDINSAARATVRSSANSPQPQNWLDLVSGKKISAKVNLPAGSLDFEPFTLAKSELPFTTAFESAAQFSNSDFKLVTDSEKVIFSVRKIRLDRQLKVIPKGYPAKLEPGECLGVIRGKVRDGGVSLR